MAVTGEVAASDLCRSDCGALGWACDGLVRSRAGRIGWSTRERDAAQSGWLVYGLTVNAVRVLRRLGVNWFDGSFE